MRKTMQSLRQELGIVSQGHVASTENSVLFHLAFRMTEEEAKRFILKAADIGTSESLYARKVILTSLGQ
ncbi:hypothetical protein LCGC14_0341130 [marine sediment metagenome]|uniref:Uncharacterized protein n=1 Tax=marine sediment metagenome TaxID=412755 RepID=A0A0F9W101_9ZZZZ